ncbi:hypothetical protein [Streptomyces sp. NPDC058701]|uniref:hypothetical protein n=1 Tax=Streptomyces sp. NPDC058701 TaxID=3346608 RepID=UPI003646F55A
MSAGEAALLITLSPVFSTVLGSVLLRDHPGMRGAASLAVALAGAAAVAVTGSDGGPPGAPDAGAGLVVAAAQACSFVVQKPLLRRYAGAECVLYGSLFGLVPPPSGRRGRGPAATERTRTRARDRGGAVLGCCCTAAVFWTWSRVLRAGSMGVRSLCLYAVPVAALAMDAVLLHHALRPARSPVVRRSWQASRWRRGGVAAWRRRPASASRPRSEHHRLALRQRPGHPRRRPLPKATTSSRE